LEAARQALSLAKEMESQEDIGLAWRSIGRVTVAMGDPVSFQRSEQEPPQSFAAGDCFAESERIFKEIEREDERARTLREWARYELKQGDQKRGQRLWEEARAIFLQLQALPEVEQMEEEYAKQTD
jgi:hypothetical protein